ncbi:MAG: YdcF family protein [Cytophagales bacterium]|nr:YdcF family protein [Bernardetiaceae bacterium]MDW8206147.1 YdcF family protein [Cytophagales bacterium]
MGNPWIANEVLLKWEVPPTRFSDIPAGKYDAAIVLMGMTQDNKSPKDRVYFMRGADRLLYAIRLYKEGKVKKIIISGAYIDKLSTIAAKGANNVVSICKMAGIPDEAILTDEASLNTYENARYTAQLLQIHNISFSKCILITSAFHMRRALLCFQKQGIVAQPFTADFYSEDRFFDTGRMLIPSAAAIDRWNILLKEWTGIVVYWAMGYL